MKTGLEYFTNDKYKILKLLKANEIKVKEDTYVPLSQQEIADMVYFAKVKTNKLLNELINVGFVVPYKGKKGKYALTEKSYKLIKIIENTNF